jgi:hypothetical protein
MMAEDIDNENKKENAKREKLEKTLKSEVKVMKKPEISNKTIKS